MLIIHNLYLLLYEYLGRLCFYSNPDQNGEGGSSFRVKFCRRRRLDRRRCGVGFVAGNARAGARTGRPATRWRDPFCVGERRAMY